MGRKRRNAVVRPGAYRGTSVRKRIEEFFLKNLDRVATRDQIQEAARDPKTGRIPENWHQRLSELRTDMGYTILSWRNRGDLRVMEYLMPHSQRRTTARSRTRPSAATWKAVLDRADGSCEWESGGVRCGLRAGDTDPVGGGTVRLTPDHLTPHGMNPSAEPNEPTHWRALCGRHQVVKKNFWDDRTGKLNAYAIVQAASQKEKKEIYLFLKGFFGEA